MFVYNLISLLLSLTFMVLRNLQIALAIFLNFQKKNQFVYTFIISQTAHCKSQNGFFF
jgi:hypothetical protein